MQLVLILGIIAIFIGLLTSQYFYLYHQRNNSKEIGKNTLISGIVYLLVCLGLIGIIVYMLFDNKKQFTVSFNKLIRA
jgi:hypothetical protein